MKKLFVFVLAMIMMLSFTACGDTGTEGSIENQNERIEYAFDEYDGYEIVFKIPKGWERSFQNDYDDMIQHIYSPADSGEYKENSIAVYSMTNLNNTFYSEEDLDFYADTLMDHFHQNIEGLMTYTKLFAEEYECDVPARYGQYIQEFQGKTRGIESYLFILSENSIFAIVYLHDINATEEYFDEFKEIVSALEFEEFSIGKEEKENNYSSNSGDIFTNKYGTPTTKCAHSGCDNYIASSGDTNCCTLHSNKCLNCNKYIDEDAMYCISCIEKALGGSNSSESFTNKYGTPTTKCAHSGCDNYIASSGDTNCCTVHSNKCLNCNKYIDEDAMYCISCLFGS